MEVGLKNSMKKKNKKSSKNNKNPFIWLGVYLIIWFVFGGIYTCIANANSGEDFVFQEDILLKSKSIEFQKQAGVNVAYSHIKKLFVNYDKTTKFIAMDKGDGVFIPYSYKSNRIEPIGMEWANYYYLKLNCEGYNFWKIQILNDKEKIIGNENYAKVKLSLYQIPENSLKRYSKNQLITLSREYEKYIEKTKEYFIWIDTNKYLEEIKLWGNLGGQDMYQEIDTIKRILSLSVNYLDFDIKIIYDYESNENFRYSLVDFLYFSAVTITTLGYGDILPNSSVVRIFVMSETLLGAIFIAIFISSFYDWINTTKKKSNQ